MGRQVAVVGAGRMGRAMAARLHGAGHRVTLYNRTRSRAEAVAERLGGATVVGTPAEAAAAADFVVVSLADDAAVRSTYEGDRGLVAGLRGGAVVLETSTIHPDTVRGLAEGVAGRGATLLDTPVSGSVPIVEKGELTVLAGGPPEALDAAREVLAAYAKTVLHLGPLGAGAVMKLAVNSVVNALNVALAEALVLAEKAGIDRVAAYDAFANSAVAAPYVGYKRAAYLRPDETETAFALALAAKDLALAEDLANETGARMEQLAATRRLLEEAKAKGLGDRDMTAVVEILR
jgi:3-hydroxyisobutyrate dehydrogenase/2-hydroxy-3-oxopropionate reductase